MIEFVIIVESEADFRTASELANRIIVEQIEWIEPYLSQLLQWRGLSTSTNFTCWKDVKVAYDEMRTQGIHLPRFLGGRGQGADFAASSKILNMIERLKKDRGRNIQAVILIRDLDNQPERRTGIEHARQDSATAVVIGMADGKREAWVLNGYFCQNDDEQSLLSQLIKQLNFDPTLESHRLRATTFDEPDRIRNAKIVLEILTKGNPEREAKCWQNTDLALLLQRGVTTGLTAYMLEVGFCLVPLLRNSEF